VPQVRGPHGQVFVRGVEIRIFGPGIPQTSMNEASDFQSGQLVWVPHPCRVLVFAARVGYLEPPPASFVSGHDFSRAEKYPIKTRALASEGMLDRN
jgi:hypothetical protein